MPKDAPPNGGAPAETTPVGWYQRVSEMQAKLQHWAAADPGRRFDDLFNFVHDPATLMVAFDRVAANRGARTPGVDGLTVADVEQVIGASGFLDDLRTRLKAGTFCPLPVRERKIPKPASSPSPSTPWRFTQHKEDRNGSLSAPSSHAWRNKATRVKVVS
jgi:RNA-directed DNA polymerase